MCGAQLVKSGQQQDGQILVPGLQAVQVGGQHDQRVRQRVQRVRTAPVTVMQQVPPDGDHLVGQDARAPLLHGQEGQVEALEFLLN